MYVQKLVPGTGRVDVEQNVASIVGVNVRGGQGKRKGSISASLALH